MAFREKMAATGEKDWTGMDVSLYHELCSSRTKQLRILEEARLGQKRKRPAPVHVCPKVCWLYNDSECNLKNCKFAHRCEWCRGNNPKRVCNSRPGGGGGTTPDHLPVSKEITMEGSGGVSKSNSGGVWFKTEKSLL